MLFKIFARVHKKSQVPFIALVTSGLLSAVIALIFDIDALVEFMSIGTLMAYTIVSAAIIILRYRPLARSGNLSPSETSTTQATGSVRNGNGGGSFMDRFVWLESIIGKHEPGRIPSIACFVYTACCCLIFGLLQWGGPQVYDANWWSILLFAVFAFIAVSGLSQNYSLTVLSLLF